MNEPLPPSVAGSGVLGLTTKELPSIGVSKIDILISLRYHLSVFISNVHGEVISCKSSTQNSLAIENADAYMLELQNSIHSICPIADLDLLTFPKSVSDEIVSDETPIDALNRNYGILIKMDKILSSLVATYRRPRKMVQKWMLLTGLLELQHYPCGFDIKVDHWASLTTQLLSQKTL